MSKKFTITDDSDDRKYFTLVPNYIINHSSHYEQSLYLVMKRLAGEQGSCFATQLTLANIMKCSQPTVSRSIDYLISHGWLKCIGTRPGKTRPVKEYKIVDIWKKNMDFYNKKDVFTQNKSKDVFQNSKDRQTTEYKIGKPQNTEEEPLRRRTIKKNQHAEEVKILSKKVNPLVLSRGQTISFLKAFPSLKTSELKEQMVLCNRHMNMSSHQYTDPGLYFKGWLKKYCEDKRQKKLSELNIKETKAYVADVPEKERQANLERIQKMKENLLQVKTFYDSK